MEINCTVEELKKLLNIKTEQTECRSECSDTNKIISVPLEKGKLEF